MAPCVNWFCFGRLGENVILEMGRDMLDLWGLLVSFGWSCL